MKIKFSALEDISVITIYSNRKNCFMKKSLKLLLFKPISTGASYIMENETIKSLFSFFLMIWFINHLLIMLVGGHVKYWKVMYPLSIDQYIGFSLFPYILNFSSIILISIFIAFLCWANFNIWTEVKFTKLLKVSLILDCLQQIPDFIRLFLLYPIQYLYVYSPFWAKTIYDSLKFIAGISEIYIVFLFIVLLYKLTKVNRLGITIFVIVVLLGVTELQNIFIQSIS